MTVVARGPVASTIEQLWPAFFDMCQDYNGRKRLEKYDSYPKVRIVRLSEGQIERHSKRRKKFKPVKSKEFISESEKSEDELPDFSCPEESCMEKENNLNKDPILVKEDILNNTPSNSNDFEKTKVSKVKTQPFVPLFNQFLSKMSCNYQNTNSKLPNASLSRANLNESFDIAEPTVKKLKLNNGYSKPSPRFVKERSRLEPRSVGQISSFCKAIATSNLNNKPLKVDKCTMTTVHAQTNSVGINTDGFSPPASEQYLEKSPLLVDVGLNQILHGNSDFVSKDILKLVNLEDCTKGLDYIDEKIEKLQLQKKAVDEESNAMRVKYENKVHEIQKFIDKFYHVKYQLLDERLNLKCNTNYSIKKDVMFKWEDLIQSACKNTEHEHRQLPIQEPGCENRTRNENELLNKTVMEKAGPSCSKVRLKNLNTENKLNSTIDTARKHLPAATVITTKNNEDLLKQPCFPTACGEDSLALRCSNTQPSLPKVQTPAKELMTEKKLNLLHLDSSKDTSNFPILSSQYCLQTNKIIFANSSSNRPLPTDAVNINSKVPVIESNTNYRLNSANQKYNSQNLKASPTQSSHISCPNTSSQINPFIVQTDTRKVLSAPSQVMFVPQNKAPVSLNNSIISKMVDVPTGTSKSTINYTVSSSVQSNLLVPGSAEVSTPSNLIISSMQNPGTVKMSNSVIITHHSNRIISKPLSEKSRLDLVPGHQTISQPGLLSLNTQSSGNNTPPFKNNNLIDRNLKDTSNNANRPNYASNASYLKQGPETSNQLRKPFDQKASARQSSMRTVQPLNKNNSAVGLSEKDSSYNANKSTVLSHNYSASIGFQNQPLNKNNSAIGLSTKDSSGNANKPSVLLPSYSTSIGFQNQNHSARNPVPIHTNESGLINNQHASQVNTLPASNVIHHKPIVNNMQYPTTPQISVVSLPTLQAQTPTQPQYAGTLASLQSGPLVGSGVMPTQGSQWVPAHCGSSSMLGQYLQSPSSLVHAPSTITQRYSQHFSPILPKSGNDVNSQLTRTVQNSGGNNLGNCHMPTGASPQMYMPSNTGQQQMRYPQTSTAMSGGNIPKPAYNTYNQGQIITPISSEKPKNIQTTYVAPQCSRSRDDDIQEINTCFLCGKDAAMRCCGSFIYCSRSCKDEDFERHERECKALRR